MLGIDMIPVTVERRHAGKDASFTWWIDDVLMDESERLKKKPPVPSIEAWNEQMWITRLFDQLIANVDRNLGNLIIDRGWRIWMIDHSRAFRLNKELRSLENLSKVDRQILQRLRQIDKGSVQKAVGETLFGNEVDALLARRDQIVAHYDKVGEAGVFTRRPQ
jgi:hypothetical protein